MSDKIKLKAKAVVCRADEEDCDELDVKLSRSWLRIALAGVFAGQGMIFSLALNMTPPPFGSAPYWVLHGGLIFSSLAIMGVLGRPLWVATLGMLRARRLSIEGLFTLSLLGAFVGSLAGSVTGEGDVFYEIVSIVIAIYTFGRLLGEHSQHKMLTEADRLRSTLDRADLVDPSGRAVSVAVETVKVGQRVRVGPGAAFTLDGRIVDGVGYVRETALTGEPLPLVRRAGEFVRAGTYSEDGLFEFEVTAVSGERAIDRILAAVESPRGVPSELQAQADRLTQYFLPIVAGLSIATAVLWGLLAGWQAAVFNSMAVLLVACPCALGLATPVAIWNGLYRLSRLGIVSRDGRLIDALSGTRHVFFDKTGTLSETAMEVVECFLAEPWRARREALFQMIVSLESRLSHPVASGLQKYCAEVVGCNNGIELSELEHHTGLGVSALASDGQLSFKLEIGDFDRDADGIRAARQELRSSAGKQIAVYCEGQLAGLFVLREKVRKGLPSVLESLQSLGIRCSVLTGDPHPQLELPEHVNIHSGLTAEDKERLLCASTRANEFPVFVGDGLNDAVGLRAACGSIAMQGGVPLARTAASGQLIDDRLEVIGDAVRLCRGIRQRLRGNLKYAAAYNSFGMTLAALGCLHPVAAAGIMLVSSFWVTIRALRGGMNRPDGSSIVLANGRD